MGPRAGKKRDLKQTGDKALEYLEAQARELAKANAYAAELVSQLEQANKALKQEIQRRLEAEQQLLKINAQIDQKVRQKTAELQIANRKLESIFNVILTGVFIVDANTHIIVDANPLAIQMVGLPREQVIGRLCHKFICPAEQDRCPITDLGQTVDRSERILLKADGTQVPVLKTVGPVVWDGRQFLVESFIDISDLKTAQQNQQHLLEELTKTNQQLKEFAYVVSHDLKAPLRGIKVVAEWMTKDFGERLGKAGCDQLSMLINRVERMQSLIDGILQYYRVDSQKGQPEWLELDSLLAQIIDLLCPPANIKVQVCGPMPRIYADKTMIIQVFQNLISNAIKYMDKPQGLVTVSCQDQDRFWRFSVSDNGPGIEARYFERIFKLFQTLAARDDGAGTGVGLALVKKIVEQYGGEVWVESTLGQGSTFFFTFPKKA